MILQDVAEARPKPALGSWLQWIVAGLVLGWLGVAMARNPAFQWNVVAQWFTAESVLQGLSVTLGLALAAMAIGTALGLPIALGRMSSRRLPRVLAGGYVWFFRGTPLLVQLIFWYNLATLVPVITLGVPFGPTLARWRTNDLITPLTAAIAGLALNEAAYMAETIRGGLLSVPPSQAETARAFGMSPLRILWRVVLPQAMRAIVPPTGNQFISMIKATSLVSVIAMADLLYSVQAVYNRTFEVVPMLLVAVLWYLLVTSVLNVGQAAIERYYARSDA